MFVLMCIGIIIVIAVIISALFGNKIYDMFSKFKRIYKDEERKEEVIVEDIKEEKEKMN